MNQEELSRIAHFALIELTEEEKTRFGSELGAVIDAIEGPLASAPADLPATTHPQSTSNVWREDVPGETLSREVALAAAPASEDGRFAVPQILGEDA